MMSNEMNIIGYFGREGLKNNLREKGYKTKVIIDPASQKSVINNEIFKKIYEDEGYTYSIVRVRSVSGDINLKTVFLDIGIETNDNQLVTAQTDCVISDHVKTPLIGQDLLSMLGISVTFDYKLNQVSIEKYSWQNFEDEVASIYRALGAKVRQNIKLAGFQIDMIIEETTPSNQLMKFAVECKYYKEKVGNKIVNEFNRIVETLKTAKLVDKGIIVSLSGFTKDASLVAESSDIQLLSIDDLKQNINSKTIPKKQLNGKKEKIVKTKTSNCIANRIPTVFVMMPFSTEFDDLYHLGIREVVARLDLSCERADEIQYVGGIVEKIKDSIKNSDIIVAEITEQNPNVYYEVGFAHALEKPVILLTKNIENTPFDLRGYNHIIYNSITNLRDRLENMLVNILPSN